jgi:DNA-binding protein YbaB
METVEELMAKVQEQQERVFEIQRAVEQLEITAFTANSEVTVKLRGNGRFTEVVVDPRAMRYDAETLGALVVEAVNSGLTKLAEATKKKFEPIMGETQA